MEFLSTFTAIFKTKQCDMLAVNVNTKPSLYHSVPVIPLHHMAPCKFFLIIA